MNATLNFRDAIRATTITPPDVRATYFPDLTGKQRREISMPWPKWIERLRNPKMYPTKEEMPLIKLARFGDARSDKGSFRHDANMGVVDGIEGDYDAGEITLADAATMLAGSDVRSVLYSSPSSTPERPRWRVLAPLLQACEPGRRREYAGRLNAVLGGILAPESFTLSQAFYIGRSAQAAHYEAQEVAGARCIDEVEIEPRFPVNGHAGNGAPVGTLSAASEAVETDPILRALRERGLLRRQVKAGTWAITCPWGSEHTAAGGDAATAYLQASFDGRQSAGFSCKHGHCAERRLGDLLLFLGLREPAKRAVANARAPQVPEHQPAAADAPERDPERPIFTTVTMIELVNAELPAREPLLAPWLCAQGLAQVHAWRGTGKTHFSLGVAYAVAAGGAFLGWQAPAPRRVLFLDGEMPAVALKERLAAIIAADTRDRDIPGDNLRFITPDLLDGAPPDLGIAEDQAALQDVIAEYDPALIVVDNISALVRSGAGENDAESWLPVQTWALRMRREGRAVLFVHHSGKGGRQRGTSKREDVLDTVLALKRPEPYDPADGARFTVEFEKARHVRGEDARAFEAHLTTDEHDRQLWTTRTLDDSTFDRVVALHRDGLTGVRDIAAELGVNASTVSRTLKKAKAIGVIESDKGR